MNFLALRTAAERRAGVAFDATALGDVVNEALQELSTEERWPWQQDRWTVAIVAGTGSYSPPAGTMAVRSVTVNGDEIAPYTTGQLDDDASLVGWGFEGEKLILSPIPGGGETVLARIQKVEPTLAADNDLPLVPAEWQSAVVDKAAAILLERIGELDRADRREKAYQATLKRMRHIARRVHASRAPRVRPGAGI